MQLVLFYTLPYTFNECSYFNCRYSKSTKPDDEQIRRFNNVQYISERNITIDTFNNLSHLNTLFPNILQLEITFPLAYYLNSDNLSFNRLRSLTVKLNNIMGYEHLQIFLNETHNLYSLKFDSFGDSPEGIFRLTSISVRRLDLLVAQVNHGNFFNKQDCINLISSPLGQQCEVLLIEIDHQTNILDLINKMPHLRILIFRCKGITMNYWKPSSISTNVIRWLRKHLSPKSSIVTDENNRSKISIWIYRTPNRPLSSNASYLTVNNRNTRLFRFAESIRQIFSLKVSDSTE